MNEEFTKIVLVPIGIAIIVFFIEMLAIQSKGVKDKKRKFKVWLSDSKEIHHELPKDINDIRNLLKSETKLGNKKLIDISELVSFEAYTGFGFDLIAAALTADILATFNINQTTPSNLTGWLVIHFLSLIFVAWLVRANNTEAPKFSETLSEAPQTKSGGFLSKIIEWVKRGEQIRTLISVLLGLFCIITSFMVFWSAL
ncbi:MAG: hypothetical protein J0L96_19955 [Anaerolineae bacterium]|nr:hypothetical protein [Anaerolineae bacterium]